MSFDKCIICIYHYSILQNSFSALKTPYIPPILFFFPSPPFPLPAIQPLATTGLFNISTVLPLLECDKIRVIKYATFSGWLLSLTNTFSKFSHVFSWPESSFLFLSLNNIPMYGCTTMCDPFIY